MVNPFSLRLLLVVCVLTPIFKRVESESLNHSCGLNETFLQIEIQPDRFPRGISLILSDLSSGVRDIIIDAQGSILAVNSDTSRAIVQKDRCLPANHCYVLAIHDSPGSNAGTRCGEEGDGSYKITYNDNIIKEGSKFQESSEFVQFGGGCGLIALDERGRRYFPRAVDHSLLNHSVLGIPYAQIPTCVDGRCTTGVPMSKQAVDLSELLVLNVQDTGFTEDKTTSLPNSSSNSYAMAAGDINGDGLVDIVIAKYDDINQILLNTGNAASPFNVGIALNGTRSDNTRAVKLADMNNDGRMDIIFISEGAASHILFNEMKDETLDFRKVDLDTDTRHNDLSVGDVNNDGWLDLIIAADSGIILFLKNGTDAFTRIDLPQSEVVEEVAFTDIDNDGLIDVIYRTSGHVGMFMNSNGNGTFLEEIIITSDAGDSYDALCVGDMDGNGFTDLILYSIYADSVMLLLNKNGTGFDDEKVISIVDSIYSIEAGDLNGDGLLDLVLTTSQSQNYMVLNKGEGGFTEPIDLPGGKFRTEGGVVIADVNHDNFLDLMMANWNGEEDILLLNMLEGQFGAAFELPGSSFDYTVSMAFGDFNQDGFVDLVVGNFGQPNRILLNKGDGTFLEGVIDLPTSLDNSGTGAIGVADLNNDGFPDVIVASSDESGGVEMLMNRRGDLTFSSTPLSSWGSRAIGIGDVNNDGFFDIILGTYCRSTSSTCEGQEILFINNGGTFSNDNDSKIVLPGFDNNNGEGYTSSIALADVNGDGWLDIVIGCMKCDNRLLINDGDGQFANSTTLPGDHHYYTFAIAVADFDLDGHIDLIIGGWYNENSTVYFNSGKGEFNNADTFEFERAAGNIRSIALADFDGDGYEDVILGVFIADNEVLINNGDRTFQQESIFLPGGKERTFSIIAGDVNSDGWTDIVGGNFGKPNQITPFSPCPNGGAQLHSASWCFHCPSFMGKDSLFLNQCKECLPDHMQQPGLGEKCDEETPCPLGERRFGEDQCSSCLNGTYYDNSLSRDKDDPSTWESDRCVQCFSGTYANTEVVAIGKCFPCTPGMYQNETGSSTCNTCESGTFQTDFNAAGCNSCDVGGYCDAVNSCNGGFKACSPGTFNDKEGKNSEDACELCPVGTFSVEVGADSNETCKKCEPGTFQDETGQTGCKSCEEGYSQDEQGRDSCNQCKEGFYAPNTGSIKCIPCPYPLSSAAGSKQCPFCKRGFYLNVANVSADELAEDSTGYCKGCPDKADCALSNTNLNALPLREGNWRDSENTATMYPCKNNACVGYQPLTNRSRLEMQTTDIYCAANHTGPLCEVCINSNTEYFNLSEGKCTKCPSTSRYLLRAFIALVIASAAIVISWLFLRRLSTFSIAFASLSLQAKVKILVGFYQVISSFRAVYGVSIDDKVIGWFNFVTFFSLDFFQILSIPKDCLGSKKVAFILNACWPYILYAVLITALLLFVIICERLKDARSTDIKSRFGMKTLSIAIVVLYFALPTVSMSIFDAKKCRAFKTNDSDVGEFKSYLLFAMEMECDKDIDESYASLLRMFWVFFMLWPCLTPLMFLLLLTKVKHSVQDNRPTPLARTCRFLWEDFDETSSLALYWDLIDTMRKIFLTGIINFLDAKEGSNKILRLLVAATVSTLYLTILTIVRPYKRNDDLYLSTISSFLLVVCFIMGIILHLCEGDDENEGACQSFVGLHLDSYRASIVVTALAFGMLLITISFLLVQTYRAPIIRLHSTGYPPNLEMPPNCKFHLFLSHIWDSGQDKTHAIARKLQLYLPGLIIWLDVDNLDDVGKLEECIAESAVVLIFYSKGYFGSENCRREFYHAVALEKPIIVVYDGDDTVIQEMKDECETYCKEQYSGEGTNIDDVLDMISKDPICLLKARSFSAETMKIVYLRLLKNLPFYRHIKRRELLNKSLRIPGELDDVSLTFQVQLLVCNANAGAFDLAKEIHNLCPDRISLKILHDKNGLQVDTEGKDGDSISNVFPIKKSDDIEKGLLLYEGIAPREANLNEVEALVSNDEANDDEGITPRETSLNEEVPLVRDDDANGDDLLEGNGSLSDSISIAIDTSNNVETLKDGLTFEQTSENENENYFSLASEGDVGGDTAGGMRYLDNNSFGALNLTAGNTPDNPYDKVNNFEYDEVPPVAEKRALLLYLNQDSFSDDENKLADIVKAAKKQGIDTILVHEQDTIIGGCPFSSIIENTPSELKEPPFRIFKDIAIPLYRRDEYRKISMRLILQKMEAVHVKERSDFVERIRIHGRSFASSSRSFASRSMNSGRSFASRSMNSGRSFAFRSMK